MLLPVLIFSYELERVYWNIYIYFKKFINNKGAVVVECCWIKHREDLQRNFTMLPGPLFHIGGIYAAHATSVVDATV